jgi:GNAT superfamily N-acetyltransferase
VVTGGVSLAESAQDIARCYAVMANLRSHVPESEFVGRVQVQQVQGYKLAYLADADVVVAVAGFRVLETLATGRTLYVDDLVTDVEQRSRGYGKTMMEWLQAYAREADCETFSLDSGTHRHEAHAFYFRERMRVTSFHFAKKLQQSPR